MATAAVALHELFEAQARRTPLLPAVVDGERTLTYVQLDQQANRVARLLRSCGVVADMPVGVCVDRGSDLVAALLGILKAGGAYLPLDTDLPEARVRAVLAEAGAGVCLTDRGRADRMPGDAVRVVVVEDAVDCDGSDLDGGTSVHPDGLVTVYFTSGSTGTPKGVGSTHRGWVNRMLWMQSKYRLAVGEAVLFKTTLSFDDSAVEIFWPLAVGGRIAILPPGEHRDPVAILAAVRRFGPALVQFVPSMLRYFMEAHRRAGAPGLPGLRHVISSGEALTTDLAEQFQEQLGGSGCQLHNQWGATEVSIDSTSHLVGPDDIARAGTVPIGSALWGNRVYALTSGLDQAPVGQVAELYIGGTGLARGYVNQPRRTAERFLPDPFGPPGSRMYRTGDLGLRRHDGTFVYVGRTDHQVKVRGVRVELGEIEAALLAHPDVGHCAVIVDGSVTADRTRLVAYVAPASRLPGPASLRDFLTARLPSYLVPARFVLLEQLPTTASGKIDRNQLSLPPADEPSSTVVDACGTATERALSSIWSELLGCAAPGPDANFFELGGNSLLAAQLVFRVQDALGVDLPLYKVFAGISLGDLAAEIDAMPAASGIPRGRRDLPIPLTWGQEQLWFLHRLAPRSPAYNTPFALRLTGQLNVRALNRALEQLVERHEVLRTRFISRDGQPVQVLDPPYVVPMPVLPAEGATGREREAAAREHARAVWSQPFDLAAQPPLRAALIRLGDTDHVLLLVIHHILCDAGSNSVLERDLGELYSAEVRQRPVRLPALELHYADFAQWQRGPDQGRFSDQLEYWRSRLVDPPAEWLPEGRVRSARPSFGAESTTLQTPDGLLGGLRTAARDAGTTVFTAILAGLQAALAAETGHADVVVGVPVLGRLTAQTQDMVGYFVNTLPLRTQFAAARTFSDLLKAADETVRSGFANQEVPLAHMVRATGARRTAGANPLFQVILNLVPDGAWEGTGPSTLIGLAVEPFHWPTTTTVVDITCTLLTEGDRLTGEIVFNPDLFDRAAVDQLVTRWTGLLEAFVTDHSVALPHIAPDEPGPERIAAELAADWTELLGVDDVLADDDFFELGGHSLDAVRAIGRIEERYGVEVPLNALFAHPTLAELTEIVGRARAAGIRTLDDDAVDALLA